MRTCTELLQLYYIAAQIIWSWENLMRNVSCSLYCPSAQTREKELRFSKGPGNDLTVTLPT